MGRPFQEQMEFETAIVTAKQTASSGLFAGGVLSVNIDDTKFDISAGSGVIIDDTDPNNPISQVVTWTTKLAVTVGVPLNGITYVALNNAGSVVEQATPFTNTQFRSLIVLGEIITDNGVNINTVAQNGQKPSTYTSSDMARALGNLNLSGNTFISAAANLTIKKEAGTSYNENSNRAVSLLDPNVTTNPVIDPVTFTYIYSDGAGGVTKVTGQTDMNPNQYDDGSGTLAVVPANKYTNQYVYYKPLTNSVFVQYGENLFNSLEQAQLDAFNSPSFLSAIFEGTHIRTILSVKKSTVNLSDEADAFFSQTGKFGIGVSGGSGASGLQDLQDVYDNSINPEIITDATRGALTLRRGSALDTDNVIEIQNGAATNKAFINGNGNGTFTDALTLTSAASGTSIIDRGSAANAALMLYRTAGAQNWYTGTDSAPGAYNGSYSIKQILGSTPELVIHTNGNIGMGTNTIPSSSLLVQRPSLTAGIEARQLGSGGVADLIAQSIQGFASATLVRGNNSYHCFIKFKNFPSTFNWYAGTGNLPVAFADDFVIKTISNGNPEFIIDKATGNIGVSTGADSPISRLQVEGGAITSGNPTGGDTGAGTINSEKGLLVNGAAGSHKGVRTVAVSTSWAVDDNVIIVDAPSLVGNITITVDNDVFQDAFNTVGGRVITVIVDGSPGVNTIQVNFEGSQNIYGSASFFLTTEQSTTLLCTNPSGTLGQGEAYILARYTN